MSAPFDVSVIIPTYKRPDSALRALKSLEQQSLAADRYEVIVVDDGSTYDAREIAERPFPFQFQYLRKKNEGATIARNYGVQRSQGDVLVFIDDDVTISPQALAALAKACNENERIVAMGKLISRSSDDAVLFTQDALEIANEDVLAFDQAENGQSSDRFRHFSHCNTQLLAVQRSHFFELDMLQDPTGGWPNWDDVDFGYRAHLAGFRLLEVGQAVGEHWDYSLSNLKSACNRWQRAGKSAVRLFQVHPGLQPHIPMFHDKIPINWQQDSPRLIVRKMVRYFASIAPVLWIMERMTAFFENAMPSRKTLRHLYRWVQGSYMYRGYREGLRDHV